jgi:hypothetical protein
MPKKNKNFVDTPTGNNIVTEGLVWDDRSQVSKTTQNARFNMQNNKNKDFLQINQ